MSCPRHILLLVSLLPSSPSLPFPFFPSEVKKDLSENWTAEKGRAREKKLWVPIPQASCFAPNFKKIVSMPLTLKLYER